MSKSTMAVYIGRFSTVHHGHMMVIRKALKAYNHLHIIIGSHEQPRTIKNPWSSAERQTMLVDAMAAEFGSGELKRVSLSFDYVHDFPYNDTLWLNEVNNGIDKRSQILGGNVETVLIGSDRDDSTFYLELFPQMRKDLTKQDESLDISASQVRAAYFGGDMEPIKEFLSLSTLNYLARFKLSPAYKVLKEEFDYIEKYKKSWAAAPYAPTFVTVDSVVTQAGHVLLIRRKAAPGKGLYAVPGGFLDQRERALDGAIRELREETRIKVPAPVLKGSVVGQEVFDKPDRSLRGRTVTIAFHIALSETGTLPIIKGGDDAASAEWVLISRLPSMRDQFFEDHYSMIETFVGGKLTV